MATRAHSTRMPLLPLPGATSPLLRMGSGRQPGPVTVAIAVMREAHPDCAASSGERQPDRASGGRRP